MFQSKAAIHFFQLTNAFLAAQNPAQAEKMAAYMQGKFSFLGLPQPQRKAIQKAFFQTHGYPDTKEIPELVNELWQKDEREFQYLALDLLIDRYKKHMRATDIQWFEQLIVQKPWWDTVDLIASHLCGAYFQKYPNQVSHYAEKWINGEQLWLNRAALLYQLKYKKETDPFRLMSYCLQWSGSEEFFHQKAIGWALREYSKVQPDEVVEFVQNQKLKPLSKREALKWVSKHKPELLRPE